MKIERAKNATRNIVFGLFLKLFQIIVPFVIRTVMIYQMGVQYLGLHSLFTSILQVLNLAELGVGNAMVYSMYKPIIEDDSETICALMRLYRTYYRVIGLVIAVVGLSLTPFIPRLIKGALPPDVNLYVIYWLNLGATCLSYWLFAYRGCLLTAHQRSDIISKVSFIVQIFQYSIQLLVIVLTKNYYFYIIAALSSQALTNIVTAIVARRMYPQYSPHGKLSPQFTRSINQHIRDLFTSKLGGVILSSSDTVVVSAFLGLEALTVFQNYNMLMTSVIGIVYIIFQSCTAGIGNSLLIESPEKNYKDLVKFTFLISWLAGVCTCCFLNLYQPFMELWMGPELMLSFGIVICFCVYYYIYEINQLLNTFKDAAGVWHSDRFRPLATALVNLSLNLATVRFLGTYGVILSTVLSWLFVGIPWLLHNLFTLLFQRDWLWKYLRSLLYYMSVVAAACLVSNILCNFIRTELVTTLLLRGILSFFAPNLIFLAVYWKKDEFLESLRLLDRMSHHRFRLVKTYHRLSGR